MSKTIIVELTKEDAEVFKNFRKHQSDFEIMLGAGTFDFSNGSCIIYRCPKGILKSIEIKTKAFVRRKYKAVENS